MAKGGGAGGVSDVSLGFTLEIEARSPGNLRFSFLTPKVLSLIAGGISLGRVVVWSMAGKPGDWMTASWGAA